jgi:ATP-dependent RNA helicase DeaD
MPADLPQDLLQHLQKVWVAGRQLNITRDGEEPIKAAPKKKFGEKKFADKKPYKKS